MSKSQILLGKAKVFTFIFLTELDTIEHETEQVEELIKNNKASRVFKKSNVQKKEIYELKV